MKITQTILMRGLMIVAGVMIFLFSVRIIVSIGPPILLRTSATKLSVGSNLTLWGIGFGVQDKGGKVLINDSLISDVNITSWSPLRIRIKISSDLPSGYIYVLVKNKSSNRKFIFVSSKTEPQAAHENTASTGDATALSKRISITMPSIVYPRDSVHANFLDTTKSPQICRTYIQYNTMTSEIKSSMWHYDSGTRYSFPILEMLWFNAVSIDDKTVTITCADNTVVAHRFSFGDISNNTIDTRDIRKQYRILLEYDVETKNYSYMLPLQTSWQQRTVSVDVPHLDNTLNYLMLYKAQPQLPVSIRRIPKLSMKDVNIPLTLYTHNTTKMIPQYLFDSKEIRSKAASIATFSVPNNILLSDVPKIITQTDALFTKKMTDNTITQLSLFREIIPDIESKKLQRYMINALLLRMYGLIARTVVGVRYDAPSLQATRNDKASKTVEGKHVLWLEILSNNFGWIPIFLTDISVQNEMMNNEIRGELNDSYIALYIIEQYNFLVHHQQSPIRPTTVLFEVQTVAMP